MIVASRPLTLCCIRKKEIFNNEAKLVISVATYITMATLFCYTFKIEMSIKTVIIQSNRS